MTPDTRDYTLLRTVHYMRTGMYDYAIVEDVAYPDNYVQFGVYGAQREMVHVEVTSRRYDDQVLPPLTRKQVDALERKAKLGTLPRTTAFSLLTTQDYQTTQFYFDYLFTKHYFWNRGFDGMYGTVARWVQTLREWNPSLTEADCFKVVKLWFGLQLPGIESLADLNLGFPDEFFSEVVYSETRRALDRLLPALAARLHGWLSGARPTLVYRRGP